MKKVLSVLLIIVLSLSLFGCAEIEYVFTVNPDETVTQQYNIYLDEKALNSYGYNSRQMKEFIFEFFGYYWGYWLKEDDIKSDSVNKINQDNTIKFMLHYDYEDQIVSATVKFKDIQTYYDYYWITEEDTTENYEVKRGFLFYRIIQKVESPFLAIQQIWDASYDKELYMSYDPMYNWDTPMSYYIQVFLLGLKDYSYDKVLFKGFRKVFPKIPKQDIEKLFYRFAVSFYRTKLENTADRKAIKGLNTYLIWEFDFRNIDREITIVTLKPNRVGWYVLALGLTAVFAGVLVLIAFVIKKKTPKIEPVSPPEPKVPPSIFGDDYR